MAKVKYKKKPETYDCIQYDGSNTAEIIAFCPLCAVHTPTGTLMLNRAIIIDPTSWVMQDLGGNFSVMINAQFIAFFQLNTP